jgi:hypothetical protein
MQEALFYGFSLERHVRTRAGIWLTVESGFPDRQVSDHLDMSE